MKDFRTIKKQSSPVINSGSSNNNNTKKDTKENWPVVSARVPPDLRRRLFKKYNKRGELSGVILNLLKEHAEIVQI